jgi:hypothetical protein
MEILDNIPTQLATERVLRVLRVRNRNPQIEKMAQELVEIARPIARPKALYEVAYVDNKNGASLELNSVKFTSRVLRVNLDKVNRVFPYVATCGTELDAIEISSTDFMKSFCWDTVKTVVLGSAITYLINHLKRCYALEELSSMNPGSLESWPITQQKQLFALFGDVEKLIGVRLTDGCAMQPLKSVSGIYFSTDIKWENCQLCPRENCVGRRAPYDPALAMKYRSSA